MATAPVPFTTDPSSAVDSFLAKQQQSAAPTAAEAADSFLAKNGQAAPLTQAHQPSLLDRAVSLSNAAHTAVGDFGKGVLKGAASTVANTDDLLRRVTGEQRLINRPDVQNLITPTNTAQKAGFYGEHGAEFLLPEGAVGAAAKGIDAITAGMKGASIARVLGRAVLDGTSAGAVAGAQTGGDPKAMRNAALAGGATSAVGNAVSQAVSKAAPSAASGWYESALKPPPSLGDAKRAAAVGTGLREGIVLNKNAVAEAHQRISDINDQITQEIANRSQAGATVDPAAVAQYTDRAATAFDANHQANPEADTAAVQDVKDEFLRTHPDPIPLAQAQTMKQGTYRKLKYGELTGAQSEAQKDLARGLKDGIVQMFPEIAPQNAQESSLLQLEPLLERFVAREGNKQLIGLGTPMVLAGTHSIPLTLIKAALDNPAIKSRIALMIARHAAPAAQGAAQVAPALAGAAANQGTQP